MSETTDKKDDFKPTIRLEVISMPFFLTNFTSDTGVGNVLVDRFTAFFNETLNETRERLVEAAAMMGAVVDVHIERLDGQHIIKLVKHYADSMTLDEHGNIKIEINGVVNSNGDIFTDPDYVKSVSSGRSTDN